MTDSPVTPTPKTRLVAKPAPVSDSSPSQPMHSAGSSTAEPSPKRGRGGMVVAAIAAAALVGGVSGAGVTLLATGQNNASGATNTSTPQNITVNDPKNVNSVTAVALKAAASVVTIQVSSSSAGGTGSGVVLSKDGYVLTNAHVVTLEGAAANPTVKVETSNGKLFDAKIIGTDSIADLAVIKVDGVTDLTPADFADSSKLNVGDSAIAIGAPLGLAGTVTDGIISALNRSITVQSSAVPDTTTQDQTPNNGETPFNFWQFDTPQSGTPQASSSTISLAVIQTDAAINPGNSGGALLNSDGKVIGINCAIASAGSSTGSQSGSIGVGFAIPANLAKRIASELINNGKATHGLLGATISDVTSDTAQPSSNIVGASVQSVVSGGAADSAGIKKGDVITSFNGVQITGATDLTAQVRYLAAGATAQLTYLRDSKSATVTVTLGTLT
jgi:putative serine protease PepD